MTAKVIGLGGLTRFEKDEAENLGTGIYGNDADVHTIEAGGNVLGQGRLWQAAGRPKKRREPNRVVAVGQYILKSQAGFIADGKGLVLFLFRNL